MAPDAGPAHKASILQRALKRCNFKAGDRIKVRGTNFFGRVVEVYTKVEDVNWDKTFPTYIHLELDGGTQRMAHHSQINRVGNNRS